MTIEDKSAKEDIGMIKMPLLALILLDIIAFWVASLNIFADKTANYIIAYGGIISLLIVVYLGIKLKRYSGSFMILAGEITGLATGLAIVVLEVISLAMRHGMMSISYSDVFVQIIIVPLFCAMLGGIVVLISGKVAGTEKFSDDYRLFK